MGLMSSFLHEPVGAMKNVCFTVSEKSWCTCKNVNMAWSHDIIVKDSIYTHYICSEYVAMSATIKIYLSKQKFKSHEILKLKFYR